MNYNYLTWNNNNYKIKKSLRNQFFEKITNNVDDKINNIIQTNINPFLINNNYVNDINNQEKYLRQKNLKMD